MIVITSQMVVPKPQNPNKAHQKSPLLPNRVTKSKVTSDVIIVITIPSGAIQPLRTPDQRQNSNK